MLMKKLLLSLCLGAACVCAFAQDPFGEVEVRADYKKISTLKEVLTIKIDIAGAQTVTADTVSVTTTGCVNCSLMLPLFSMKMLHSAPVASVPWIM